MNVFVSATDVSNTAFLNQVNVEGTAAVLNGKQSKLLT